MKKITIILLCLILTSIILLTGCATRSEQIQQCKTNCYDVFAKSFNSTNDSLSVTEIKAVWDKKKTCLDACDK
jgi:uncharacterized lipoprotein YajG